MLGLLAASSLSAQTTVLSQWTFEVSLPNVTGTTSASYTPEVLASGQTASALGVHASSATVYSNPAGNGSAESFSSNNWATGDYYQFSVTKSLYQDVIVSWDHTSSSTGPLSFSLAYSVDGSSFSTIASYAVIASTGTNITYADSTTGASWTSAKVATNTFYTYDLSSYGDIDAASIVYFRLVSNVTPSSTAGTSRVDNFTISAAAAVPEPSTYALVLGLVVLAGVAVKRRGALFAAAKA